MELMIVVVIIGILAGLAVPLYNGLQERAKRAVGQDNVDMLNNAILQLITFDRWDKEKELAGVLFDGSNLDHHLVLMDYLGYMDREEELKYVEWKSDLDIALEHSLGRYVIQESLDENGLKVPSE